jgi:hypothetical protein
MLLSQKQTLLPSRKKNNERKWKMSQQGIFWATVLKVWSCYDSCISSFHFFF